MYDNIAGEISYEMVRLMPPNSKLHWNPPEQSPSRFHYYYAEDLAPSGSAYTSTTFINQTFISFIHLPPRLETATCTHISLPCLSLLILQDQPG